MVIHLIIHIINHQISNKVKIIMQRLRQHNLAHLKICPINDLNIMLPGRCLHHSLGAHRQQALAVKDFGSKTYSTIEDIQVNFNHILYLINSNINITINTINNNISHKTFNNLNHHNQFIHHKLNFLTIQFKIGTGNSLRIHNLIGIKIINKNGKLDNNIRIIRNINNKINSLYIQIITLKKNYDLKC